MPSRTSENYLKQLYFEEELQKEGYVSMGRLAAAVRVAPGTATAMVKSLSEAGLVRYAPRLGVRLTDLGKRTALKVLRRHRLVELFLVQILGLDWAEVHAEAEEWEHVTSEKVLERMDALLGHPAVDPHGDPIPTVSGAVAPPSDMNLVNCPLRQKLVVTRVLDQEPKFLNFVRAAGLTPGAVLTVQNRSDEADALHVHPQRGQNLTLSQAAGAKFLVQLWNEQ